MNARKHFSLFFGLAKAKMKPSTKQFLSNLFFFYLTGFERDTLQEKVRTLQETCTELQERIHQMDSQISQTKVCLDKEKAKYYNACRQQEVSPVARATE